jgi:hypothetical protein
VAILLIAVACGRTYALSGQQKGVYDLNIYQYDVDASTCTDDSGNGGLGSSGGGDSGTPGGGTGGSGAYPTGYPPADKVLGPNIKTAYAFLTSGSPKYTAAQAAGLVGNMMSESYGSANDIDPNALNPNGGAYGIVQWLGSRLTEMKTWVTAEVKQYNSISGQLDFVKHELQTSEANPANADLLKQTDPEAAAYSVYLYYEAPGDGTYPDRESNALEVYNKLSDIVGTGGGDTGSDCTSGSTGPVDCSTAQGTAKILCEAEPYNGIYYRWGGAHQGYDAFVQGCPDPSNPPDPPGNHAHGAPADPTNGGLSGNPSPCATDCSGLVSIAVDAAFNKRFMWSVSSLESDSANWRRITFSQIQPGDVLTQGDHHVEIVDQRMGGGLVETFGSHETGTRTSTLKAGLSIWSGAYRYIGPQS